MSRNKICITKSVRDCDKSIKSCKNGQFYFEKSRHFCHHFFLFWKKFVTFQPFVSFTSYLLSQLALLSCSKWLLLEARVCHDFFLPFFKKRKPENVHEKHISNWRGEIIAKKQQIRQCDNYVKLEVATEKVRKCLNFSMIRCWPSFIFWVVPRHFAPGFFILAPQGDKNAPGPFFSFCYLSLPSLCWLCFGSGWLPSMSLSFCSFDITKTNLNQMWGAIWPPNIRPLY